MINIVFNITVSNRPFHWRQQPNSSANSGVPSVSAWSLLKSPRSMEWADEYRELKWLVWDLLRERADCSKTEHVLQKDRRATDGLLLQETLS